MKKRNVNNYDSYFNHDINKIIVMKEIFFFNKIHKTERKTQCPQELQWNTENP